MNEAPSPSPSWPPAGGLEVGDGHRLWWCEGGDPQGLAVLVVHGGPGGASRPETVRWFDGLPVRWIVFDQRGCGRSTPAGATRANRLAALVADAESLRQHLGIARWAIVGGSWGARVALACAAAAPQRIAGLFLRSPFLGSAAEASRYASAWELWLAGPGREALGAERCDRFAALFQDGASDGDTAPLALEGDPLIAQAWSAYDDAQSAPGGVLATGARYAADRLPAATAGLLASWRVHAHYASTGWTGEAPELRRPWSLDTVAPAALDGAWPIRLVWGEADATCDPAIARTLADRWPGACARAVPGAGHRMGDPRLGPVLATEVRAWVGDLA